jgi:hypothetical integral membrane protein (TIGR02206 family)
VVHGEPVPAGFEPFSSSHAVAVGIGAVAIAVLVAAGRRGGALQQWALAILAFFCLAAYPLTQLAWALGGDPIDLESALPLHLCGIVAIVAGFALLTRRPTLCELTYYWGLAASLQGLLTPAIDYDFPHPVFVTFFLHHGAIVGGALFLPLALGWRPRRPLWRTFLRAVLWTELYVVVMLPLNCALGTNFGFLARKPDNPSLLDHLGPWPYYLLSVQAIGLLALGALTLPFARPHPRMTRPTPG